MTTEPQESRPAGRRRSRRWIHLPASRPRQVAFVGVYLLFCLALVLVGSRLFWKVRADVPLTETAFIWDCFYPEIRRSKVEQASTRHADGYFDVLLLGGSVLEPSWGTIESELTSKLRTELPNAFRVFNLGHAAHTSRDSLIKYQHLAAEEFELVIVYDGINDVRMNYCPAEDFRDDYSHFAWYRSVQRRIARGEMKIPAGMIDPALMVQTVISAEQVNEWRVKIGSEVRTTRTLRSNLENIVDLSASRGDSLILLTFACDIPAEYAREKFANHELAYGAGRNNACGAELWGRPEYVAAAVDAQNVAIRDLAAHNPNVVCVDQDRLLPKQQRLFADPCHLTDKGCRRFVDHLWPAVERRIEAWKDMHGRGQRVLSRAPEAG